MIDDVSPVGRTVTTDPAASRWDGRLGINPRRAVRMPRTVFLVGQPSAQRAETPMRRPRRRNAISRATNSSGGTEAVNPAVGRIVRASACPCRQMREQAAARSDAALQPRPRSEHASWSEQEQWTGSAQKRPRSGSRIGRSSRPAANRALGYRLGRAGSPKTNRRSTGARSRGPLIARARTGTASTRSPRAAAGARSAPG